MKQILSIQYLRALAAMTVVAFHTEHAVVLCQFGVDIFFVISGFIMWTSAAKPIRPGEFLWHRIIRVVPLYWLLTLIESVYKNAPVWDVVRSLLFWPFRPAGSEMIHPVSILGWTLNYEMFFYAVFAAMLLLPHTPRLRCLSLTLGGLAMIGLVVRPFEPVLATYTNPLLFEFLFGVWIAELRLRSTAPPRLAAMGIAMILVGAGTLLISLGHPTPTLWRFVVWGVPSALIVAGALAVERGRGIPTIPLAKVLGDSSYSVYLTHPLVMKWLLRPIASFSAPVIVLVSLVAAGALGVLVYYRLEKPMTAWLRRNARWPVMVGKEIGTA